MKYNVKCHCGGLVQLDIETDLSIIKQCNCSICKRKNAKMNIFPKESIKSIQGEENLSFINLEQILLNIISVKNVVYILIILENLILMVLVLI